MSITQTDIDSMLSAAEQLAAEAPSADFSASLSPAEAPSRHPSPQRVPPELARILHMRMPIIVKLAERDLPVGSVLKLNIGSILEFERRADAELELMVNNRVIGRGVTVKVGENFGLRLTAVGDLEKTIQALGPQ